MRTQVQSLVSLSGLRIRLAMTCGVGRRRGSDPVLLWLWCRLAATALIRPLAWEPHAHDAALKSQKEKNKQQQKKLLALENYSVVQKLYWPFLGEVLHSLNHGW